MLAQNKEITLNSNKDGFIPAWVVAGPFEFPLVGFGEPKDTTAIGEPDINPVAGDYSLSSLPEKEKSPWFLQSVDEKGFIDFKKTLEWNVNTQIPVKIWYSRAGYAYTTIVSDTDKEAVLTFGSNSQSKIYLNKEVVYTSSAARNALQDQDSIRIKLKKGKNELIIRVNNTHTNLGLAFFGVVKWEWGFYARLLENDGSPLTGVKYILSSNNSNSDFNVVSTIYFKNIDNQLKQRFDIEINSLNPSLVSASIKLNDQNFAFENVPLGRTRHSVYLPELTKTFPSNFRLNLGSEVIEKKIRLESRKKYTMHLMLLNHTDIGYTHPQPVCEELHCNTLDDVLKACREHPDFHWTIETTWQLEAYERLRSKEQFDELISLIKLGRVAVSPIYTNPFTGLISEEEMLRSFDKAIEYKNKYGITFNGAVYNDVPGQSWFLPQVLTKAGVKLVAEGINEVYGDYKLQRNLPKAFKWEGPDGSQVITYINEAYNEGRWYGLESGDLFTVEQTLWEKISKLEAKDYKADIILLNSSFSDNSILPKHQYDLAMKWNEQYEYPKFISSNISEFTTALINSNAYKDLPVLKGDWISNWDIFYQGEFERNKKLRISQHQLLSAEKLSTLSSITDSTKKPMNSELSEAYRSLLHFTGHGSGLEYGYGSPEENKLTMEYRDSYVNNAYLGSESVLLKSVQMLSKPEESLDSEGLFIFNSLSWKRDDLIEFHFPFDSAPQYDVIDPSDNKIIPSFRKDHRQYFIARNIPSFGYKKYLLKPKSSESKFSSQLKTGIDFIENEYYKISITKNRVSSIVDKKSGNELLNSSSNYKFTVPSIEKFQINQNFSPLDLTNVKFEIVDERPVRLALRILLDNAVVEKLEYYLQDGIDKVFIEAEVNLDNLNKTETVEEYGLPFNLNIPGSEVRSEILGGYIDQQKDRLPGIDHDGVSLRRSAAIFNSNQVINWAAKDARVIRIRDDETGNKVIISNIVNNFPDAWNRHEDNSGKIKFLYAFSSSTGAFNPAATSKLGYELNTPVQIRKSWFRAAPPSEEFLTIDNPNISLLNLKSSDEKTILRLINHDSQNNQSAVINSRMFAGYEANVIDLIGNNIQSLEIKDQRVSVTLKPGEYMDILLSGENISLLPVHK